MCILPLCITIFRNYSQEKIVFSIPLILLQSQSEKKYYNIPLTLRLAEASQSFFNSILIPHPQTSAACFARFQFSLHFSPVMAGFQAWFHPNQL